MRHYCTFFLRSNNKKSAVEMFQPSAMQALVFQDEQTPANLASSIRMQTLGFVIRNDLPRFSWHLDTRQAIGTDECDPFVHVSWLLSQLRPGTLLGELRRRGVESSLGFYWGGNGTGGGPYISSALAELLVKHQIDLDLGFYYERNTDGDDVH